MATVITFSIQKGGSGKTTTSSIVAHMLSKQGKRTLLVDMDSQGNSTELLTGVEDIDVFRGQTVLEAMKEGDARPYIKAVTENLHILPADDFLATFARWIYTEFLVSDPRRFELNVNLLLEAALREVQDYYEYIIIDTPPSLSEWTINSLSVADFVVIPFETSKFCYSAVKNFLGTVEIVQQSVNPNLQVAGILRTLIDHRRKDARELIDMVKETYGDYCHIFDTVITRTAHVGRLSLGGFVDNPELPSAERDYEPFFKELMEVVSSRQDTAVGQ